jgi:hypothetical protein
MLSTIRHHLLDDVEHHLLDDVEHHLLDDVEHHLLDYVEHHFPGHGVRLQVELPYGCIGLGHIKQNYT